MTEIRIDARSTNVGQIGTGAASGSPAQQAYDRAVKQLADAQKKLSQDVFDQAPEATIEVDQALVETAALAVSTAAAALAREQEKAQSTSSPSPTPSREPVTESESARPSRFRLGDLDVHA